MNKGYLIAYFLTEKRNLLDLQVLYEITMTNFPRKNSNFFFSALYQILQNYAILINHELFFQEKESLQLYRSQFLKINYVMAETIKNQFSKTKFF